MRSEKEIREFIKLLPKQMDEATEGVIKKISKEDPDPALSLQELHLGKKIGIAAIKGAFCIFQEWLFKGEPRYSTKELEKIIDYMHKNYKNFYNRHDTINGEEFVKFLKDEKKVKKILKEE